MICRLVGSIPSSSGTLDCREQGESLLDRQTRRLAARSDCGVANSELTTLFLTTSGSSELNDTKSHPDQPRQGGRGVQALETLVGPVAFGAGV